MIIHIIEICYFFVICSIYLYVCDLCNVCDVIYSGASIFKFCGEEITCISRRVGCDVVGYVVVMCVA